MKQIVIYSNPEYHLIEVLGVINDPNDVKEISNVIFNKIAKGNHRLVLSVLNGEMPKESLTASQAKYYDEWLKEYEEEKPKLLKDSEAIANAIIKYHKKGWALPWVKEATAITYTGSDLYALCNIEE